MSAKCFATISTSNGEYSLATLSESYLSTLDLSNTTTTYIIPDSVVTSDGNFKFDSSQYGNVGLPKGDYLLESGAKFKIRDYRGDTMTPSGGIRVSLVTANGVQCDIFSSSENSVIGNIGIVYDDEAQRAGIIRIMSGRYPSKEIYCYNYWTGVTASDFYTSLRDIVPILYTWQSVPSISGKNGILLMPTLSDTNNGNPVSGASSSAFIKAPSSANNIRNLVDLSLEPTNTDDAATIFYTIPDGTYTSIKLYGRIGENPKCNSTDDIIEDINQNDTSISVENLECEEYYFCIQAITADLTLSSNVVSIDLGGTAPTPVIPPEYQALLDIINSSTIPYFYRDVVTPVWQDTSLFSCYIADQGRNVYLNYALAFDNGSNGSVMSFTSILRFDITSTSTQGQYSFTCPGTNNYSKFYFNWAPSTGDCSIYRYNSSTAGSSGNTDSLGFIGSWTTYDKVGSMTEVLTWISKYFKNVDIYVDGVCWSKVSS